MAQAWSWPKIKWKLAEADTSLARLARDNGYKRASFSKMKVNISPPIQQIIADALGVKPRAIWPDRYHRDGRPKAGHRRRQYKQQLTPARAPESRLNREAA